MQGGEEGNRGGWRSRVIGRRDQNEQGWGGAGEEVNHQVIFIIMRQCNCFVVISENV